MKIKITAKNTNLYSFLRKAGYSPCRDLRTKKESFIRPLHGWRYPRFHIYYLPETNCLQLHLDQKSARYSRANDHAAEYGNSEIVKKEAERIKQLLEER